MILYIIDIYYKNGFINVKYIIKWIVKIWIFYYLYLDNRYYLL